MSGFYLYLPSHDKSNAGNSANHYRIRLATSIDFGENSQQWEVALTELMCSGLTDYGDGTKLEHKIPFMIDLVTRDSTQCENFQDVLQWTSFSDRSGPFISWQTTQTSDYNAEWTIKNTDLTSVKLIFPKELLGFFEMTAEPVIVKQRDKEENHTFASNKDLSLIIAPNGEVKFTISWSLLQIELGNEEKTELIEKLPFFITCILTNEENLKEKLIMKQTLNTHLFIYTDIVEYQAVGSDKLPLLRVVDSNNLKVQSSFVNPYYIPVAVGNLQEISILLYNSKATPIDFSPGGRTVAVLHFRQRT